LRNYLRFAWLCLLLAGCVSTHVTTLANKSGGTQEVQRLVLVFPNAHVTWEFNNLAATVGEKNLQQLAPLLRDRLPALFTKNGLPTRYVDKRDASPIALQAQEHALLIKPTSASFMGRGGASGLHLQADLLDPVSGKSIWTAEVSMSKSGLAKLDEGVADHIALQILDRLRADKVAALAEGPWLNLEGKSVETAPKSIYAELPWLKDSGFAKVDDVMAVPYLSEKGREGYRSYLNKRYPRAFAIAPNGNWAWSSTGLDVAERALAACNKNGKDPCELYSIDNKVLWRKK